VIAATAKVHATTDARFAFDVLRSPIPVLVEFFAAWCPSCAALEPVLDELADDWEGHLAVVKIDVDRHRATAERYGIMSVPTLVLFDAGEERQRLVNVVRRKRIEAELEGWAPSVVKPRTRAWP